MRRGRRPHNAEKSRSKDRGAASSRESPRARGAESADSAPRSFTGNGPGTVTLWGRHAVAAALANPDREILATHLSKRAETTLADILKDIPPDRRASLPAANILDPGELLEKVPGDAVHQGLVVVARPLPGLGIESLVDRLANIPDALLVVLDQVTDPHNVGAVLRSAAAFGASGLIVQSRHTPPADGVLAKSASGALERVPIIEVTNIARAIDTLKDGGFWCVGLSGDGEVSIEDARLDGKIALVLGAEGPGLRRLPRERCDVTTRLPTLADFGTLNISNAAAIALYEARRAARKQ